MKSKKQKDGGANTSPLFTGFRYKSYNKTIRNSFFHWIIFNYNITYYNRAS